MDQSHLAVLAVTGGDRLSWLHSLLSAQLEDVDPGSSATALALDPHGHVEHEIHLVDDGSTSWLILEPGSAPDLLSYLDRMRFMLDVEVRDATAERAAIWRPVSERSVVPDLAGAGRVRRSRVDPSGVDRGGGADKYVADRPALLPVPRCLSPGSNCWPSWATIGRAVGRWRRCEPRQPFRVRARRRIIEPFRTRWAGSAPRSTLRKAVTAARRPSRGSTTWVSLPAVGTPAP